MAISVQRTQQVEPRAYAQATEARRTSTRSANITITTAEGDKVTLSVAAQNADRAATYRARGRTNSQTQGQTETAKIRGQESSSQSASQVSVKVEGNLNQRELGEIQKLLAAFGEVTQGRSSAGDLAQQFGSLESLSTAKLNYTSSDQTNYARVQLYG